MEYNLKINFSCDDLANIYKANQKVTLIKESSGNSVPWVTFTPFQCNKISWDENYSIFASTNLSQHGVMIDKVSETNANDGIVYDFNTGIFRRNADEKTKKGSFQAVNNTSENLTLGLAQTVTVNNNKCKGAPITASTVLAGQSVTFTPIEKVKILLHSNETHKGQILSEVSSQKFSAYFGQGQDSISIEYNGLTGKFNNI
ncbi:hypothetical protein VQL36_16495 [Chengkuizengella sp. SCS-71B]|uniref:hypothetical protein n=1 Tax=Chengkuizengella sp. SCS-71B TaxID=3115290 RepID=UPI0032C24ACA